MKTLKLINRSIILLLTSLLLVSLVVAWYVSNTEVRASGIHASSASANISLVSLKRYKIASNASSINISSTGSVETADSSGETTLNPGYVEGYTNLIDYYDYTTHTYYDSDSAGDSGFTYSNPVQYDLVNAYSKILYEITFTSENNNISFDMSVYSLEAGERSANFEGTSPNYYNFISNVLSMYTCSVTNGAITVDSSTTDASSTYPYKFSYCTDETQTTTVTLLKDVALLGDKIKYDSTNEWYTVYFLLDYDSDRINRLYSANIAKTTSTLSFKEDLSFVLY